MTYVWKLIGYPLVAGAIALVCWDSSPNPLFASHADGADAISIDMNPVSAPANTATTLGSRQTCARVEPNNMQDADEDVVDGVALDVTVTNIPPSSPLTTFTFTLNYNESALTVTAYDINYLLAANAGSNLFDASDFVPDADWSTDMWTSTALDFGEAAGETGSGVLQRVWISADSGVLSGYYSLTLTDAVHNDQNGLFVAPHTVHAAQIAVGVYCPGTDSDSDGVYDIDENACGGAVYNAAIRPERVDGAFAGVSDDGDALIDEPLPTGSDVYDCDGDGYKGAAENNVYLPSIQGDQDPCGTAPTSLPFNLPIGWPADLAAGSTSFPSGNKINVADLQSFTLPVRRLDTSPGDVNYDRRWDVVPGPGIFPKHINADLQSVSSLVPPMLGGVRAMNGPPCPWPP